MLNAVAHSASDNVLLLDEKLGKGEVEYKISEKNLGGLDGYMHIGKTFYVIVNKSICKAQCILLQNLGLKVLICEQDDGCSILLVDPRIVSSLVEKFGHIHYRSDLWEAPDLWPVEETVEARIAKHISHDILKKNMTLEEVNSIRIEICRQLFSHPSEEEEECEVFFDQINALGAKLCSTVPETPEDAIAILKYLQHEILVDSAALEGIDTCTKQGLDCLKNLISYLSNSSV